MNNYSHQYNGMPQTVNPYVNYVNTNSYFRPPAYEVVKVHGREGANAFQMGPNSSILLLDENDPIVWLAKTDGAGYKTVTPFRIAPYEEAKRRGVDPNQILGMLKFNIVVEKID